MYACVQIKNQIAPVNITGTKIYEYQAFPTSAACLVTSGQPLTIVIPKNVVVGHFNDGNKVPKPVSVEKTPGFQLPENKQYKSMNTPAPAIMQNGILASLKKILTFFIDNVFINNLSYL